MPGMVVSGDYFYKTAKWLNATGGQVVQWAPDALNTPGLPQNPRIGETGLKLLKKTGKRLCDPPAPGVSSHLWYTPVSIKSLHDFMKRDIVAFIGERFPRGSDLNESLEKIGADIALTRTG